jgi:hypothetical protein
MVYSGEYMVGDTEVAHDDKAFAKPTAVINER